MTHTPGPWVFSPERDTHDSIIHTANAVEKHGYIGADNGGVVGSSEWIWIKDEDARLIATAPDLLEALEAFAGWDFAGSGWEHAKGHEAVLYDYKNGRSITVDHFRAATAAIAKARKE